MSDLAVLDPRKVFAWRSARIAFGAVLLLGACALVTEGARGQLRWFDRPVDAAVILRGSWLAATLVAGLVRVVAGRARWARTSDAMFVASFVVPVAGLALLLPLSIHLVFAAMVADLKGFDDWARGCLVVTGPAHLVFAGMCMRRAHRLARGLPAPTPTRIWGITMLTSCVPFVILLAIPQFLIALTSIPIVPLMIHMQRWIERHRAVLASLPVPLPNAVVVRRRSP